MTGVSSNVIGGQEYHDQIFNGLVASKRNEIVFLPTGLGDTQVVDRMVALEVEKVKSRHSSDGRRDGDLSVKSAVYEGFEGQCKEDGKREKVGMNVNEKKVNSEKRSTTITNNSNTKKKRHVVVCVLRPAHALSRASSLQGSLGRSASVGAYCGGDYLYDFEEEFQRHDVLIFTAGLLMRLVKLKVYDLHECCSLLVLHDAIHAVRNHPMNTLVREYYWKKDGKNVDVALLPRILCTISPLVNSSTQQWQFDKLRQNVRKLVHCMQADIVIPTGPALECLCERMHHAHMIVHGYNPSVKEQLYLKDLQKHLLCFWDILHEYGQNHFGRLIHFPGKLNSCDRDDDKIGSNSKRGDVKNMVGDEYKSQSHRGNVVDPFNAFHHDWEQILLTIDHSIAHTTQLSDDIEKQHFRIDAGLAILHHVRECVDGIILCMAQGILPSMSEIVPSMKGLYSYAEREVKEGKNTFERNVASSILAEFRASPMIQKVVSSRAMPLDDIPAAIDALSTQYDPFEEPSRIAFFFDIIEQALAIPGHEKIMVVVRNEPQGRSIQGMLRDFPLTRDLQQCDCFGSNENEINPLLREDGRVLYFVTADWLQKHACQEILLDINDIVWFNAANVMHAAGPDLESMALMIMRQICGTGNCETSHSKQGPTCHILATNEQSVEWLEVCKADQLTVAALQLVNYGDASLEESLIQLAACNDTVTLHCLEDAQWKIAIPPPSTTLHALCLGLCGIAPRFDVAQLPSLKEGNGNDWQASVLLPKAVIEYLSQKSHAFNGGTARHQFSGEPSRSCQEARDSAAETALHTLMHSGMISAYWHTRQLVECVNKIHEAKSRNNSTALHTQRRGTRDATVPSSPFSSASNKPQAVNERLICGVCGIVTTSKFHLEEHLRGRRHLKNLERLELNQGARTTPCADTPATAEPVELVRRKSLLSRTTTLDLLPSSLSDVLTRRTSSLKSQMSPNIYDGYPCVRVGDIVLPSSMDLGDFIAEMNLDGTIDNEITHK